MDRPWQRKITENIKLHLKFCHQEENDSTSNHNIGAVRLTHFVVEDRRYGYLLNGS